MAELGKPIEMPDFGTDWEAEIKWVDKEIFGTWKDRVIRFGVADGYAVYLVNDDGITLHHVPFGDAYRVHDAMIRGLRKQDIEVMLQREKKMREIFS